MSVDAGYRVARRFVAGLALQGVEVIAVGAGSRSTSLALAFHDDGRFKVYSFVDERSAAFFVLGAARATGKLAAVVTTSGTAAANLLPAAVEARGAGVPLLLLTADRPPELHDVGTMQTVEQVGMFQAAVWSSDLHTYDDALLPAAGHIAAQACAYAAGPPPGPVHINFRFREPLVPSAEARAERVVAGPLQRNAPHITPDPDAIDRVAALMRERPRGLIYCGHLEGEHPTLADAVVQLSRAAGYPVIAEATSRLRGRLDGAHLVDAAESLIRTTAFADRYRPDLILRIGATALTRDMRDRLDAAAPDAEQVVIAQGLPWPDPARVVRNVIVASPASAVEALASKLGDTHVGDDSWAQVWAAASARARGALDDQVDSGAFFEGTIVRSLMRSLPDDALIYTATSLPIRALDAFTSTGSRLDALASRGASGIDGTTSAALGAAAATGRPTVCLTGDLAFLHDIGGLMTAARHDVRLVTVVVDNGGGGIFEFLPQGTDIERDTFEDLFATSHALDLMHAADLYGMQFASVHGTTELDRVLKWAFTEGKSWVIRAEVRRADSVAAHQAAWAAVASALET